MQTRRARLARSPVLGVRPSALIRYRVPGPRCQVPGTWNPGSGSCLRKTRPRGMQDRDGSDPGYLVPGTRYLKTGTRAGP
jgi:hypothetical protein